MKTQSFFLITILSGVIFFNSCSKESIKSTDDLKHPDSSYLPLIFLCGQSNMEGTVLDKNTPAEFTANIPGAYIFYKPSNNNLDDGNIETLKYGVNNNWRDPDNHFGPEEGIAYYLTQQQHKIAIVKYAYGGSKLSFAGSFCPNGYWQCNASDSFNQYSILINNWAKNSITAFKKAGFKPYVAAFVWCQGETDAHELAAANAYKTNLMQLLNKFKADMLPEDSLVNNMRVIITRTRGNYPYSDIIRKAQETIAGTYHNAYLINSDGWPLLQDDIHFTSITQATLQGKAIAEILAKVIP